MEVLESGVSSVDLYETPRLSDGTPQSMQSPEDSPRSQTTQFFTPQGSFLVQAPLDFSPVEGAASCQFLPLTSSDLALSSTAVKPVKKKKHSKGKGVVRRVVQCVACCGAREIKAQETPRRLRSGDVDLTRFEKSEGQIREAFLPQEDSVHNDETIPAPLASHPINLSRNATEECEEADVFLESVERLKRMSGTWQLVKSKSDSYAEMSALLELNWIFRTALDKSDILRISVDDDVLHQRGQVFRLVELHEAMNLAGKEVILRRRDLRRGPALARTILTPTGYINKLRWNEPVAGGLTETMDFSDDGKELSVHLHIYRDNGRTCDLKLFWERRR